MISSLTIERNYFAHVVELLYAQFLAIVDEIKEEWMLGKVILTFYFIKKQEFALHLIKQYFRISQILICSSTKICLLVTLSFIPSNSFTCPLVDSSTYHVTLSFIYPVYKQLVYLSTCLLFNKKTSQPCIFNKFCYICKLFNTYVSHVC